MDYPRLRNVEAFPARVSEKDVICVRDPFNYTERMLFLPPNIFFIISLFDGRHSIVDIQAEYARRYGQLLLSDDVRNIIAQMDAHLFLASERFTEFKHKIIDEFKSQPVRHATHAGLAYESEPERLKAQLDGYFESVGGLQASTVSGRNTKLKGIIAPHIDLRRGGQSFALGYNEIKNHADADTFVIFGTGHYPTKNFFVLTEKDFETSLGTMKTDKDLLKLICKDGGKGLFEDEFVHKSEHSIEFQVLFLQHTYNGARKINIIPILCSSFHELIMEGISPLERPQIADFISSLKDVLTTNGRKVCMIASVDLAHVGLRFGDAAAPTPDDLQTLSTEDVRMLKFVERLDAEGFYNSVKGEGDRRRICGFPAIYTFLNVINATKGKLLRYEQCNDDKTGSTVTFASMAFY